MKDAGVITTVVWKHRAGGSAEESRTPTQDTLVVEAPLELRVDDEPFVTTMRTPGQDRDLALGLLYTEGIIRSAQDIGALVYCGDPADEGYGNILEIRPGPGVALDIDRSRRGTLTSSACGVCGRQQIDDLLRRIEPIQDAPLVSATLLVNAPGTLEASQRQFAQTGGVHAAAALDARGQPVAFAEDVGRHNAVDKVIGELLRTARQDAVALVVSGRVSFEIVQKAAVGRFPYVVAVSAPTSLAVELAQTAGITVAGFTRDGGMNLYSHVDHVRF